MSPYKTDWVKINPVQIKWEYERKRKCRKKIIIAKKVIRALNKKNHMIIQLLLKKDTNYFKFPPLPISECQQKAPGMMQKKKIKK